MILRRLTKGDEEKFFQAWKEWEPDRAMVWFSCWKPGMSFDELLAKLEDEHNGINLPDNFVPCTVLYGFDNDDNIVGRLSIRHKLSEFLKVYGGHIGYAVIEKYRGRGYATEMLRQSLPMCAKLGMQEVLLTVSEDNLPSIQVIKKCGGRFIDSFHDDAHKRITERYYINEL